jgi:integrase
MAPVIGSMPRPRPPHLHREPHREPLKRGEACWYVRIGHGPRTRIKERYGTPEFDAAYQAAIRGEALPGRHGKARGGTLQWLWDDYRRSSDWSSLANATRRQRENIMRGVLKDASDMPLSAVDRDAIIDGRERRAKTPSQANNFLNTMRALFSWAVDNGRIKKDPTEGVKIVKRPKTGGFHAWTEDEVSRFEARWPVGTRERLAFTILLFTGLRRGDAAILGRQHVSEGVILMRAEKTGAQLTIPILPELARVIEATKTGDLTFVATPSGGPMRKESFGNWFGEACRAAKVPGSAHGLRKAGAARAASNGATVAQLNAIFGWSDSQMASLYTKSADRVRLAKEAIDKLSKHEK